MGMYQLKEPKSETFSSLETNGNNKLRLMGNEFISLNYKPTDPDYQNAAISFMRDVGINVADYIRTQELELDEGQFQTAKDCYYFSMRDLYKEPQKMAEYGYGYITSVSLKMGHNPLEVLDSHLESINRRYEANHGAKPDNRDEFNDAVTSYYKEVLNFGRPAYDIQAEMDVRTIRADTGIVKQPEIMAEADNEQEFDDFANAVANIQEIGQEMEQ